MNLWKRLEDETLLTKELVIPFSIVIVVVLILMGLGKTLNDRLDQERHDGFCQEMGFNTATDWERINSELYIECDNQFQILTRPTEVCRTFKWNRTMCRDEPILYVNHGGLFEYDPDFDYQGSRDEFPN